MRKNKGFNKLEEAILKMRNKRCTTTDMTWDEYGNPSPIAEQVGNNPDMMNMTVLRNHIVMYLDNIESHGTKKELMDATDVLFDFLQYIDNNKQS